MSNPKVKTSKIVVAPKVENPLEQIIKDYCKPLEYKKCQLFDFITFDIHSILFSYIPESLILMMISEWDIDTRYHSPKLKWIFRSSSGRKTLMINMIEIDIVQIAFDDGNFEGLKRFHNKGFKSKDKYMLQNVFISAFKSNRIDIMEWAFNIIGHKIFYDIKGTTVYFSGWITKTNTGAGRWILENLEVFQPAKYKMQDAIAKHGGFEDLKILYEKKKFTRFDTHSCHHTCNIIDNAIESGNVEFLKWLILIGYNLSCLNLTKKAISSNSLEMTIYILNYITNGSEVYFELGTIPDIENIDLLNWLFEKGYILKEEYQKHQIRIKTIVDPVNNIINENKTTEIEWD